MNLTLTIFPGSGARTIQFEAGHTLADLVVSEDLQGRQILIDGQSVDANVFREIELRSGMNVFATMSVKGN